MTRATRAPLTAAVMAAVAVGVLGSFTSLSAVVLAAARHVFDGRWGTAVVEWVLHLGLGGGAVMLGPAAGLGLTAH